MDTAVIGAGWAGCSAAVTLARLGHRVTLYETAPVAGGRARRVVRAGLPIDNGLHLLLGAYVQTRNVLAVVNGGDGEAGLVRSSLAIAPLARVTDGLHLRTRRLPAPFGVLAGLLTAQGLDLAERVALVAWFQRLKRRGFRCDPRQTAEELIADGPGAAATGLWNPLCLAALNTPPQHASAQIFANVLRAAFAGGTDASDFLLTATDLSDLFPDQALRFVEARGGRVALQTRVQLAEAGDESVTIIEGTHAARFDAVIVAVGPHQLDAALPRMPDFVDALRAAEALHYEPIATVWLGYASRAPFDAVIARLDDAPGQWVVDRPDVLARAVDDAARPALAQLVAVVISASGPHEALAPAALATACDAQLRRLAPGWPPLAWSQCIVEQRATYACTPGRPRPLSSRPHARVALAGDWLDEQFPATLEAAVRTGVTAATALDDRDQGRGARDLGTGSNED